MDIKYEMQRGNGIGPLRKTIDGRTILAATASGGEEKNPVQKSTELEDCAGGEEIAHGDSTPNAAAAAEKIYLYCSLTTIPSRIPKLEKTINSLLRQTVLPDKIIVQIPREYNFRFRGEKVNTKIIDLFYEKYENYRDIVIFHYVDEDDGPGTKLTGFLKTREYYLSAVLNSNNSFVIVVDDDVEYQKHFIESFAKAIYENGVDAKNVYTFQKYYIWNIYVNEYLYVAMCVAGFCINCKYLHGFSGFFEKIKKYDFVLYHDELYMSYYATKLKDMELVDISEHRSGYQVCESAEIDALNKIKGKYDRCEITPRILQVFDSYYPDVLAKVRASGKGVVHKEYISALSRSQTSAAGVKLSFA